VNLPKLNDSPLVGGGLGSIDDQEGRLVHNDYIRAAVELGLLGFAAFVCLLLAALGGAVAAYRRIRSGRAPGLLKAVAAGGIGVSIAFVVICVTSNVLTKPVTAGLAFTLVAMAHAAGRRPGGTAG
jgi:O-antigen ligase